MSKLIGLILIAVGVLLLASAYIPLETVSLGGKKIMHGQTVTFTATIKVPCTIDKLSPAPGTRTFVLGTLGDKVAAYGQITVTWNIAKGQVLGKTDVPKTVTCTVSFIAWKGEYWGDEAGEPAPEMGIWVYPKVWYTPTVTTTQPPEEPAPPEEEEQPTPPQPQQTETLTPTSEEPYTPPEEPMPVPPEEPVQPTAPQDITVATERTPQTAIIGIILMIAGAIIALTSKRKI